MPYLVSPLTFFFPLYKGIHFDTCHSQATHNSPHSITRRRQEKQMRRGKVLKVSPGISPQRHAVTSGENHHRVSEPSATRCRVANLQLWFAENLLSPLPPQGERV